MSLALASALAAYLPRDRVEQLLHPSSAMPRDGVALIADISGFTPLTEALAQQLSADRGAEELTRALDVVFTPLIAEIHHFRGSVIKFLGDALIVWYPRSPHASAVAVVRRALTSAWRMQRAIERCGRVDTPIGEITLTMKIGLAYGQARRFIVGAREHGYQDVLCGRTLDQMSEAEHAARPGEIVLDDATHALVAGDVEAFERRAAFVVLASLRKPARPRSWPTLDLSGIDAADLVGALSAYVPRQVGAALASERVPVAALKPVICLFVLFEGIDYDGDPAAGDLLQTYVVAAQQVVARYGGFLMSVSAGDKGSMLHIVFGAPQAVEAQAERAVRCALDLRDECGKLSFLGAQRIGISAGRAFAGPLGAPERHAYTTIGDTINLAARLMQRATADQILLDSAVRAQIGAGVIVDGLGSARVKGKAEPIPIYAAVRAAPSRHVGRSTPLVGRRAELAALRRRLAALDEGRGGVTLLIGEVGMGKTLLIDTLHAEAHTYWADAVCQGYGQPPGGALFADLLSDLLDLPPGIEEAEAARRLAAHCADLFGPASAEAAYPFLARLLGLPLSESVNRKLDGLVGESVRWRIGRLIEALLRALLRRGPLVLALDDLQWADPTSLYLLETIVPIAASEPLLILLALRPEQQRPAWALGRQLNDRSFAGLAVERMILKNLDASAAVALVETYAPGLPVAVVGYLAEKSSGNPLFLIELVRTLRARGMLADGADASAITLGDLDLPDSVQGLLLAQIDLLAVEERHTLQVAAVIGATFERRVLTAVLGDHEINDALAALERGGYISPTARAAEPSYSFAHRLLQESAYSTLLFDRRRAYHRDVAGTLERLFPTRIAEQAGLLSFHYERAELFDPAAYYQLQAADQDRLLYANNEAEAGYRKALELLKRGPAGSVAALERRAQTFLKIAQVHANQLDFDGAQEFYDQAFALMEQNEAARAHAGMARSDRVLRLGVRERGPVTLDPALSAFEETYDIVRDLFEGLVELDSEMNVIPALAQRWRLEDGGRRYRFELRPGLRWSDGMPLTARDFVFAWRRNLHPATGAPEASQLFVIEGAEEWHSGEAASADALGIQALSDQLLEIRLKAPVGYFLYLLTATITYPQPAHAIDAHGADWSRPEQIASNGPFRITNWHYGQEIRLERNPFYRGFAQGNLEAVQLLFVEPSLEEYERDAIDWCRIDAAAPAELQAADTIITQRLGTFFLAFACDHAPFDNPLVRRAFVAALDRNELVRQVAADIQLPATGGIVPPGMPGHSPDIGPSFDPAAARDLLRRAGVALPARRSITLGAVPGAEGIPSYLRTTWQRYLDLPIAVAADIEIDELVTRLSGGLVDVALVGWSTEYPDPDGILRVLFHSASPFNCFGWRNPHFDELVDRAATSANQQERLALYHEADRILVAEEAAAGPLFYYRTFGLLRPPFALSGDRKIIRGHMFKLKDVVVSS